MIDIILVAELSPMISIARISRGIRAFPAVMSFLVNSSTAMEGTFELKLKVASAWRLL
jgi:hypothetical protein